MSDLNHARSDRPLVANAGELRSLVHQAREDVARESRPWTADEAAEFLSFEPETIRRWARDGKLAGTKIAGEWRFSPSAVRALLPQPVTLSPNAAVVEAQMNAAYTRMMRGRGRTA